MKSLSHILGTSARFDLLRALYYQHNAVGLRQMARLAGVHPHSAERMLKDLVEEHVVVKKRTRSRNMFSKNVDHPDWLMLRAVIDAADNAERLTRRTELDKRARSILPFIEEAGSMLRRARRSIRVA